MSGDLTTEDRRDVDCVYCRKPMDARARICVTCRSYRSRWKNVLTFYGSIAGGVAIIFTAVLYIPSGIVTLRRALGGQDKFEMVHVEYPGDAAFFNSGDGDIFIQSLTFRWPGSAIDRVLIVPVNLSIRPGQMEHTKISSLYKEPEGIDGANWVYDKPTKPLLKDAFAIGDSHRCAVFHMFDHDNPSLQVIEALHPELPVAYVPAKVMVNVLHMRTDLAGRAGETASSEPVPDFQTAFLKIDRCPAPAASPQRAASTAP